MTPARDKRLVVLLDCPNQHPVAHRTAIDERKDHSAARERLLARRGQSLRAKAGTIEIEREHPGRELGSEQLAESFEHRVGTRQVENDAAVRGQTKRDLM